MNKILIIGVGGIGSYLVREIQSLIDVGQINLFNTSFTIADDDIVELEQVRLQNFDNEDVGDNKAVALTKRYASFKALQHRINYERQLKEYDLVVLCVDNDKTRELVIRSCRSRGIYKDCICKEFIDLRATGRKIFAKGIGSSLEDDLRFIDSNDLKNYSCQDKDDLNKGQIQIGNRIVATIGTQMILNYLRGHNNRIVNLLI